LENNEVLGTLRCIDCAGIAFNSEKKGLLHLDPNEAQGPLYVREYIDQIPFGATAAVVIREKESLAGSFNWLEDKFKKKNIKIIWIIIPDINNRSMEAFDFKDVLFQRRSVYFSIHLKIPFSGQENMGMKSSSICKDTSHG